MENVKLSVLSQNNLEEINGGWDLSKVGEIIGGGIGLGVAIIVNSIEMARDIGMPW